jgi:hypothetical protein
MKAFPIAAATVPTTQKSTASQSGATEKADFHQVLRTATKLDATSSSADAKSVTPQPGAQPAATPDTTSLPLSITSREEKLAKNTPVADTMDVASEQAAEPPAALCPPALTNSSKVRTSAPSKLGKAIRPTQDFTRADKAAAAPIDSSHQLAISAQPAPPLDLSETTALSTSTAQPQSQPTASDAAHIDLSSFAPGENNVLGASAIAAAESIAVMPELTPIVVSPNLVPAIPSAATQQKSGTRPSPSNGTTNATRAMAPEALGTSSLEPADIRVCAHFNAFMPEPSAAGPTHPAHMTETKSPMSQASRGDQMHHDSTSPTSSPGKEARTTSPDHDANTSLRTMAHASLVEPNPILQIAPAQMAAEPATQSAISQGATSIPAVAAHNPSSPALPGAAAQPVVQSTSAAEPPHTIDTAQLRVQGNQSELKVSVQLPELGKVEVRAVSTHDVTTAHVTAFRHDAIPMLAAERAGLEDALRSHNVILGSVGSQAQGHANPQQRQQNSPTPAQSSTAKENATAATTEEASYPRFLPDHASISVRA